MLNNQKSRMLSGVSMAAIALAALAATPAVAQQAGTQEIEEIIVTATKRAESIQDVSLSVQAFGAESLAKGGINDVSRLELLVSGVNYATVGNDAKINIRGANSTNTYVDAASIVGTFTDGVYNARASQQTRSFFDVERIEFLKGPQGTLYGRNTFAGAINLYTNGPDLEDFSAGFSASYERFNTLYTEGFLNLPVNDRFGLRIAAFVNKGDGFVENDAGHDLGAPDARGIRVSALFEPSETVSVLARYHFIEETGHVAGLFGYGLICRNVTPSGHTDPFGSEKDCNNPLPGSGGKPLTGPWNVSQDFTPEAELKEQRFSVEINADLGFATMKVIGSRTKFENNLGFDFDFSAVPYQVGGQNEEADATTFEVQFNSDYESAFQWTTGAYWSHERNNHNFYIHAQRVAEARGPATQVFDNGGNPVLDAFGGNLFLPVLSGTGLVNNDIVTDAPFSMWADSQPVEIDYWAFFGQGEFSITDQLRVVAGLRYQEEDKALRGGGSASWVGAIFTDPQTVGDGSLPTTAAGVRDVWEFPHGPYPESIHFDPEPETNLSWRLGAEYDLSDNAMLYVTAGTGYLSGSLNAYGGKTDDQTSRYVEAGLKSMLLEGKLLFNAAVHMTEYDNLVTQKQTIVGGVSVTESINGGLIKAWGVELEALYLLGNGFVIGGNLAYLNSEYTEFGQSNPYQLLNGEQIFDADGARITHVDMAGETTPWSPELTIALYASYEWDLGDKGSLTAYVQNYFSTGYNTSNLFIIDPIFQQDSYSKTDLRLTWYSPTEDLSVEAFVENIQNEATLSRGNNAVSNNQAQTNYGYPRNFGVRVRAKF